MDSGCSQVEDVTCGGDTAGVLIGASLGVCRKRAVIDGIVVGDRGAVGGFVDVHVLATRSIPVRDGSWINYPFGCLEGPLIANSRVVIALLRRILVMVFTPGFCLYSTGCRRCTKSRWSTRFSITECRYAIGE